MKLSNKRVLLGVFVAPHTGAWIETVAVIRLPSVVSVAPHTGAWIETAKGNEMKKTKGRTPHGCVD